MTTEEWYFPTPDLSHLAEPNFQTIYDPSQETLQFMDALQSDYRKLSSIEPDICIEVGSGSGALITFLASMLRRKTLNIATDINFTAVEISEQTGRCNQCTICGVCADLLSCLEPRLRQSVDVIIFNPPYIATNSELVSKPGNYSVTANPPDLQQQQQQIYCVPAAGGSKGGSYGLTASYAGGKNGREVMDRLLTRVNKLLSTKGIFYLAVIEDNDIDDIIDIMRQEGFTTTVLMDRTVGSNPDIPYCLRFERILGSYRMEEVKSHE